MSLEKLLQDGAEAMAANRFEDAVGIYSEACQMSNLENGKDDPDLMFLYVGLLKGVSSGSGSGSVDAVVARDLSGLVKKRKKNSSGRVSK
ncbi:hypothetical protein C6P42_001750 [Pichia californica]|nr:hypothetical protein C6P42_001750 [[Candida] californica]